MSALLRYLQKYRFLFSLALGLLLCLFVISTWQASQQKNKKAQKAKVTETSNLITLQFTQAVQKNINNLENLRSRLQITKGNYFDFWKYDANLLITQNSSLDFMEWIDESGVIRDVEPLQENKNAIGLDITNLDYRRDEWLGVKEDSTINITHWLELVQGPKAFLIDAPLFFRGKFQGTITAGMNFKTQFDEIMQGLDQYHVTVKDSRGIEFYAFGDSTGMENFKELRTQHQIDIIDADGSEWEVTISPNHIFEEEQFLANEYLPLGLGLILSVSISILLYFVQTSVMAQKSLKRANEKIRALIESSPMAIYTIDGNGVVQDFWNKAAEEMLGWTQEEALGRFIPHVEEEKQDEFLELMENGLNEGDIRNKEIIRRRKDGSKVYLRLNVGRMVGTDEQEQQMLVILEDITRETEYKQQLENSVHEKEVLLSEVHHRVKNNLAIIVGLIELQKEDVNDEKLETILRETQNRIYSISGVHELLYNTESFTDISFEEYAIKLIDRIQNMFDSSNKHIEMEHNFETRNLNINQAIPLGLLLNELVTNSFKHAFREQEKGKIVIHLVEDQGVIKVDYRDNGMGVAPEVFNDSQTLGVTLIKTLLSQLEAEYNMESDKGMNFTFHFKIKERGAHSNL